MSEVRHNVPDPSSPDDSESAVNSTDSNLDNSVDNNPPTTAREREIGGRPGPDPTRYGDWEKNGRCIDF